MKAKVYLILLALFSVLYINACKDSGTEPDDKDALTGVFFPNGNGTWYKYNISTADSTGAQTNATRSSTYSGTQSVGGIQYQVQMDTIALITFPQSFTNISLVRVQGSGNEDERGVFYYVDTTGFSQFIPDSLRQFITVDSEVKLFRLPFNTGISWTAFLVQLNYLFEIKVIEVKGEYLGTENVNINLTSGAVTKTAMKVRYTMDLTIPDPSNLFNPKNQHYQAHAWVVDGIGIVKWEGNGAILGAFTGAGIDLGDTTSVVSQSLIQYDIK